MSGFLDLSQFSWPGLFQSFLALAAVSNVVPVLPAVWKYTETLTPRARAPLRAAGAYRSDASLYVIYDSGAVSFWHPLAERE